MKKSLLALCLGGALLSTSAMAHEAGDFLFRLGGVHVKANSSSETVTPIQVNLNVRNNTQLGLTFTYMFTDNIGVELLGATPFSHKINGEVPALGANADLGRVVKLKHLPPSLYAQYYFFNANSAVRPYVGAGLNYTRFFSAKSVHPAVTELQVKKHSVGPVVNAGLDVKLNDNLYFNVAGHYTRIKTTAKFDALGASHEVKVKLDPVVLFSGLTFKF